MLRRWGFRRVLPVVMTAVQLGLLFATLAQEWHLPTNPGELHRRYPPTAPTVNSDGTETVNFEMPREPKTSTLFKVATALSGPAMLCGMILGIPLHLLGLEGGEVLWIVMSAVFGFVMWRQIGRWMDEQWAISRGSLPARSIRHDAPGYFGPIVACFPLALGIYGVTLFHHRTAESSFIFWTWIAWSGGYVLLSLWGGKREMTLSRANAATCTADESSRR